MSELIKLDSPQLQKSGETNWSEWYEAEQEMLFLWVVYFWLIQQPHLTFLPEKWEKVSNEF